MALVTEEAKSVARWFLNMYTYFQSDNFKCGSPERIEVHHIQPFQFDGKDIPVNMITVCKKHHRGLEPKEIINHKLKAETARLRNKFDKDRELLTR